jgi:hypothetical protein
MKLDQRSFKDLVHDGGDRQIVEETYYQVIKDFRFMGIKLREPANLDNAYQELFDQIFPLVTDLMEKNNNILNSLLYKIDLSQKSLKSVAMANHESIKAEIICELILQRELEKVLLRNYFKRKDNT